MLTIDKLCYYSRLRYVNAMEKFTYTVLTLVFCVASRSLLMAVLVLAVNGILTVKKGGIPFSDDSPCLSDHQHSGSNRQHFPHPFKCICISSGKLLSHWQLCLFAPGCADDSHRSVQCFLSVFSIFQHSHDRYSICVEKTALPRSAGRTDASDLPVHLPAA